MDNDSDLFVSEQGELRRFPEHAGSAMVIEPTTTLAQIDREAWAAIRSGRKLPNEEQFEVIRWHRVRFEFPGVQVGILRLLEERDELREQVCFLVDLVDLAISRSFTPPGFSTETAGRWRDLWRRLQAQAWFRERDRS